MAYTTNTKVDEFSTYYNSFGNIPSGTTISDPMGFRGVKVDTTTNLKSFQSANPVLKAMRTDTGGSGSTDNVLVPIYLDPKIADVSRVQTPLVTIIPRVTNLGIVAAYNRITAKGGGYTAIEDAPLPETNTTFERKSVDIKYLYSVGRVTGPGLVAIPGFDMMGFATTGGSGVGVDPFSNTYAANAMQKEVLIKMRELKELEENLLVNGDATTDATQFSGIVKLQGTTNRVNAGGAALTLAMIDEAILEAFEDGGFPNIAICDPATYTDLLGLLNQRIGYMQSQVTTEWGFTAIKLNTMVGQITVIPSRYLTSTPGSKSMYFLDLRYVESRVLHDVSYERLAKTNDSTKFMLKEYMCLILRAPEFNSSIQSLA